MNIPLATLPVSHTAVGSASRNALKWLILAVFLTVQRAGGGSLFSRKGRGVEDDFSIIPESVPATIRLQSFVE
jgi:hypothetical protein